MFFLPLIIAAALIAFYSELDSSKWAVVFLVSSGLGGLYKIIPIFHRNGLLNTVLSYIDPFFSLIPHTFYHYGLIMYAMVFSGFFSKDSIKFYSHVLLIPIFISFFMEPWNLVNKNQYFYIIHAIWVIPYNLYSCWLLISSYFKEKNKIVKQNRLFTAFILVPTILAGMIFIYIAGVIDTPHVQQYYKVVPYFIAYSFALFFIFSLRNGVLGVKIRLESHILSQTMSSVSSGTDIINHTMKNEISKIKYLSDRIDHWVDNNGKDDSMKEVIGKIADVSNHMMDMVDHIRSQMAEIVITRDNNFLSDILDKVIANPNIERKNAQINVNTQFNGVLNCDRIHVEEALNNIINNAIEAMEHTKRYITISTFKLRNSIIIQVADSGHGIPKELLYKVVTPFFTTKKDTNNYGLGLSYCSEVMKKHKGKLVITSDGEGTIVKLIFPR
jgi:signal transduction histidine kinase